MSEFMVGGRYGFLVGNLFCLPMFIGAGLVDHHWWMILLMPFWLLALLTLARDIRNTPAPTDQKED